MTWTSSEVYAKDLQPGDRFTSRWQGDHSVAMQEACTVVTTGYRPLGGLSLEIEMPSGDHATRVFAAGNRVFRWTESSEVVEPEPMDVFQAEAQAERRKARQAPTAPRFTLTDEKDPDHPGILDAERPDMVAGFSTESYREMRFEELTSGRYWVGVDGLFWTPRITGEPEVAAAVKGLGPDEERSEEPLLFMHGMKFDTEEEAWNHWAAQTKAIREAGFTIAPESKFLSPAAREQLEKDVRAEATEGFEDDFPTEIEKLKALELHLGIRDFHDDKILELRRELRAMWGDD